MSNNYDEDRVKQLLDQMPQVRDQQSKEELFSKLNQTNNPVTKRFKRALFIPSVATLAVAVLLLIMFQSSVFKNYSSDEAKMYDNGRNRATEESSESNFETSNSVEQESEPFFDRSVPEDIDEQKSAGEYSSIQTAPVSYVAYKSNTDITLVPAAAMTKSVQHLIPITILDRSPGVKLEKYYNELDTYIREEELGVTVFPFEGITFNIDEKSEQVHLTISNDFEYPNGSAMGNMFDKMLSAMFGPLELKTAVVDGDDSKVNQLGPFGETNWQLTKQENISYKYYKFNNASRELLTVASVNTFDSIDQALIDMQHDDPDFNLDAPIPTDTNFTVKVMEDQVNIAFTESVSFGNNQATIKMVEALLMTVKSFGYKKLFLDIAIDQVGTYDLGEPIEVPDGANPIYLH